MTDFGFLMTLALAFFLAVDPVEWRLERIALTKHLPLIMMLPFVLLTLVAARLQPVPQKIPQVNHWLHPLLGLAAFIVVGSLYARFQSGIQNTFLFAGVYICVTPMAAFMVVQTAAPMNLLRVYLWFCILAGLVVFVGLAANYGVKQVYHELEYIFPPLAVYFAFLNGHKTVKWAGFLFFLTTAFLFKKNTGYITAILVVAYLMVFLILPKWAKLDGLRKMVATYSTIIVLLISAALATFILANRDSYLPTGNTEFRTLTYTRAWERFVASPAWGSGFTAAGTEAFTGFDTGVANNILPTHSDILDILANGGLVGFGLWLWGMLRVAKLAYSSVLDSRNATHPLAPYGHMFACMSIAAIPTYAFNPLLLQPAKSMLLWANLGFLVGISLLVKEETSITKGNM